MPVIWTVTLQRFLSNLSGKENEPLNESEILQLLNRVPNSNALTINYTTYNEVQMFNLNLRNDCSSGHDNTPVKFFKPVVDQITSPIVHITNTSNGKEIFSRELEGHARVSDTKNRQSSNCKRLLLNIYFTCFIQGIWKSNIESTTELHQKLCCLQPYPVWFSQGSFDSNSST